MDLSPARRAVLVAEAYVGKFLLACGGRVVAIARWLPGVPQRRRLTDTYLTDPALRAPGPVREDDPLKEFESTADVPR